MADIDQIITLGIGTPSDIEHFILYGLNSTGAVVGQSVPGSRHRRRSRSRTIYRVIAFMIFSLWV